MVLLGVGFVLQVEGACAKRLVDGNWESNLGKPKDELSI